jgi:ketosteroid isomerase-like protein
VSQENVEVVRRSVQAWQRDDLDSLLSVLDPDLEWLPAVERALGGTVYHGHEGARELWNLWRTELQDFWIEIGEIRDLGDGRVLQLTEVRFRGPASGLTVESRLGRVLTVRDRKIVRAEDYPTYRQARNAVGLEE